MRELILLTADKPNGHRLDDPLFVDLEGVLYLVEQRVTQWYNLVHMQQVYWLNRICWATEPSYVTIAYVRIQQLDSHMIWAK